MAGTERIKEEIGWLKLLFALLAASELSLIGWIAQHYEVGPKTLVIGAAGITVTFAAALLWLIRVIYQHLNSLEEA